eukprot:CAMPEP_0176352782 /NCGR_PEP_ID=MMETSP0126-20121128/11298_1 /TAXON_ID=141414 ORGANISM="Strombidinopsis acuminatum, Strain SPMC142" /NCGR_SAMPLE_ID=MMETSP0126 /ASSEMBLY_ACC=CAM_ASM_000229 /LENGTH=115 /DNA_ID=CAMNT_0017704095 /DNA_START=155 /DNA_END=499 /DNA_ORIENTATION=+
MAVVGIVFVIFIFECIALDSPNQIVYQETILPWKAEEKIIDLRDVSLLDRTSNFNFSLITYSEGVEIEPAKYFEFTFYQGNATSQVAAPELEVYYCGREDETLLNQISYCVNNTN